MGQTDTLLDFGQEEFVDFGQENNIPENNSSELEMASTMVALENYQPVGYFMPMLKDTNLTANAVYGRFRQARIKHRIKYIRLSRVVYLYNVQDVCRLFKDIDYTKLPTARKSGQRISTQTRKMAAKLYVDGYGIAATAKALNTTTRMVLRARHMFCPKDAGIRERCASKRKQAEQLYLEGYKLREIADKVGLGLTTIKRHIKNQNIPRRKDRAADFEEQLIKCYNAGTVIDDLRKKFHIHYTTLKKCFLKHNVDSYKPAKKLTEECKHQIVAMRKQGASWKCIRATLHVSHTTIQKCLAESGLITQK
jgi:transposase-like protein